VAARLFTHEGGPAALHLTIEQQLRRSVLSCLLWEKEFYEDGQSIADRIVALAEKAPPAVVAALAVEARGRFNLRHAPLLLYQVARYDRQNAIRLRDVLFLSHAKPANDDQQHLWKRLADN
jgi:hypothetical protein